MGFANGTHAIVFAGFDSVGGMNPAAGPEYVNLIDHCSFTCVLGPAIFQDMRPLSFSAFYRSFQPHVHVTDCRFYGPHIAWGHFDHFTLNDCTIGWDQGNGTLVPQYGADGLPLALFTFGGQPKLSNMLLEKEFTVARDAFVSICAYTNLSITGVRQYDAGGCFVRVRSAGNEYASPTTVNATYPSGQPQLVSTGLRGSCEVDITDTSMNIAGCNWLEVYDEFPSRLHLDSRVDGMFGTYGIWVNDSVNLYQMIQRHGYHFSFQIPGYRSPVMRIRYGAESTVGTQSGAGITDITAWFTAYMQGAEGSPPETVAPHANLFTTGKYDAAQFSVGGTASSFSTDTSTGYTLTKYHATAEGQNLTVTMDAWGAGVPAGRYCFSVEQLANFDGELQFCYVYNVNRTFTANASTDTFTSTLPVTDGTTVQVTGAGLPAGITAGPTYFIGDIGIAGANTFRLYNDQILSAAHLVNITTNGSGTNHINYQTGGALLARSVFSAQDTPQRHSFPFYFPGLAGDDSFKFLTTLDFIPNIVVQGLYEVTPGVHAAPYTFPVDSPTSPTTQTTLAVRKGRYQVAAVPTTGTYKVGDVLEVTPPVAGTYGYYVCVVGGTAPSFRFEGYGLVNDTTDPTSVTGHLRTSLLFNNSGATVNTGTSVTKTAALVGAQRGDEVKIVPYQDPGDGWILSAEIDTTDVVQVTITNATGTNAAIPHDPFGLDVVITQHPTFEGTFPSPKAWLTADTGYDAGTGTWTDQFGLGNSAGPQATSGKRPTPVTGVGTVGGHSILRGTNAANTELPVVWDFGSKTSLYFVMGNFDGTANVVMAMGRAGSLALRYNRTAHTKEYEFVLTTSIVTVGTTVNHADWHVIGIVQDDAGNQRTFFDGVKTNDFAAPSIMQQMRHLFSYDGTSASPNFDMAEVLWYDTDHTDIKAAEICARLKGKYKL